MPKQKSYISSIKGKNYNKFLKSLKLRGPYIDDIFSSQIDSLTGKVLFTKDALLYQDIILYYFKNPKDFKLTELQNWLIKEKNFEFKIEYQGFKSRTSYSARRHAKEPRINSLFNDLLNLKLIKQTGKAFSEKLKNFEVETYSYTLDGKLLALIIKNYYLIQELKDKKNDTKQQELSKNNEQIYDIIINQIFPIIRNSISYVNFYLKFFELIYKKGYFDKIISYFINILCSNREIIYLMYLLKSIMVYDFVPYNKLDRRIFHDIWKETINSISVEEKNIILFRLKQYIEFKFMDKNIITSNYEKKQFELRSDYEKIVLEGYCNECDQYTILIWSTFDYKKNITYNVDEYDNIKFQCNKCKQIRVIPCFMPRY